MSKYLIINADDFGYNEQQNSAIQELLNSFLITSTSLMSVAPSAEQALDFAKNRNIEVGVHLTINSDDENNIWRSACDAKSFSGGLPSNQRELIRAKRRDVRQELEAQYSYIINNGGRVDHADNHCATLYGLNGRRFYLDAFDFCREHSLPFRFPKTSGFIDRQLGRAAPSIIKAYQNIIVNSAVKRGVKLLDDLVSNPWNMERIKDYNTLEQYYLNAVDNCIDGVTEMFLHPALPIDGEQGEWQKRVLEYQILKSGSLLERARQRGVEVVSWKIYDAI